MLHMRISTTHWPWDELYKRPRRNAMLVHALASGPGGALPAVSNSLAVAGGRGSSSQRVRAPLGPSLALGRPVLLIQPGQDREAQEGRWLAPMPCTWGAACRTNARCTAIACENWCRTQGTRQNRRYVV
eukprot:2148321-Pyramimonas_sp.AAC.1